jgi:hypothetical protein
VENSKPDWVLPKNIEKGADNDTTSIQVSCTTIYSTILRKVADQSSQEDWLNHSMEEYKCKTITQP